MFCSLVLAGGYDERLPEARDYMWELRLLVDELGLAQQVHDSLLLSNVPVIDAVQRSQMLT